MNPLRHPRLAGAATFAVGFVLALLAAVWQTRDNAVVAGIRFDALVLLASEQVVARLQIYEYGRRGARGAALAAGLDQLDGARYRLYSEARDLDREFPGARGIGVIRRVAPADEAAFLATMQRNGEPRFAIRQFAPHEGERYVVQYIEPRKRNEVGIGIDVASEESRRTAADLSAQRRRDVDRPDHAGPRGRRKSALVPAVLAHLSDWQDPAHPRSARGSDRRLDVSALGHR